MSNKITGKITGKMPNKMNSKNFTGLFAGSVMGSVIGSFKAVLLVGLLFSIVAGVASLKAQEGNQARQQGWFVGVSPFVMDVKLKKTSRRVSEERTQEREVVSEDIGVTANDIIYDATVPDFLVNDLHKARFGLRLLSSEKNLQIANTAIRHAKSLCKNGEILITTEDIFRLKSYDATESLTDDLSQLLQNTPATTIGTSTASQDAAAPLCEAFFESGLSSNSMSRIISDDTTKLPDKTSEETTEETSKLKGTGISFGFNFEKYSLSFNQLQWSAGDDKLQAQVLLARYFLPYGLSVGGGLASAKLGTSFGSASGTAPALHFAYNRAITKNLQVEVGLFWLGLDLAVQDIQIINSTPTTTTTTTPTTTTAPNFQRRAIVGLSQVVSGGANNYFAQAGTLIVNGVPQGDYDTRIVVTAKIPGGVSTTTTTTTTTTESGQHHQTAEIKNPATISINFIWRFR